MPVLSNPPPPERSPPGRSPAAGPLLAGPLSGGPFAAGTTGFGFAEEMPLFGVTILAVEDSRFACEALRLMARRAGARLRRAESIKAARAHLRVYRPDVVLIDLGLPDGRGETLIREVVLSPRRPGVVLGTSALLEGRSLSLAAGAQGFLEKPVANLAQLCRVLKPLLPDLDIHTPQAEDTSAPPPDPLALRDDLAFAARALDGAAGLSRLPYVRAFLGGLAKQTGEPDLLAATTLDLGDLRAALVTLIAKDGPLGAPR
jgi:CheY-like chemotaxis protein